MQRGTAALLVSMLCGGLVAAPGLDERAWPGVWVGLALWIGATDRQPPAVAFRRWLLGGLAAVGIWFYWLPSVAARHLDVSLFTAGLVTALAVVWDAFRFGVFGFLVAALAPRGRGAALSWPVLWVGLEWLWPQVFPWRMGHMQAGCLPLCQVAELTGAYGVSFLVMWGAAAIVLVWREGRAAWPDAAACGAALVVCLAWGAWRMGQLEAETAGRPQLRCALVQPGNRDETAPGVLRRLSRPLVPQADVVVWGEGAVGYFADDLDGFQDLDAVRRAARYEAADPRPCPDLACPLLCGGGSFAPGSARNGPYRNTAYLIGTDGRIVGRYHKRVLMPWGEYAVGQQWVPGLHGLLGEVDSWIAGDSAAPLPLSADARLGVLICYEDLAPRPARETVLAGANVLVNLNNLETFAGTLAPRQHQLLARFRTIENRRWLVRCGSNGSTAVISATGRIVQQAPLEVPTALVAAVPLLDRVTIYTRYGDVFAVACTTLAALLVARLAVTRRRPAAQQHAEPKQRQETAG